MQKKVFNIAMLKHIKTNYWKNEHFELDELISLLKDPYDTINSAATMFVAADEDETLSNLYKSQLFIAADISEKKLYHDKLSNKVISNHSLITLDLKSSRSEVSELVKEKLNGRAVLNTNLDHHNKVTNRLYIPLSRNLDNLEYQSVARQIVKHLGAEHFSSNSFDITRPLYLPLTFLHNDNEAYNEIGIGEEVNKDKPILNPDEFLREYSDYRNVAEWYIDKSELKVDDEIEITNHLEKQFLKTSTITEVLNKYLPDVYEKVDDEYSLINSEIKNSVKILDNDTYFKSFDVTDETFHLQPLNAFELIRMKKYHQLDVGQRAHTLRENLNSYKAAIELINEKEDLSTQLIKEEAINHQSFEDRLKVQVKTAEVEEDETDEVHNVNDIAKPIIDKPRTVGMTLSRTPDGRIKNSARNLLHIMNSDENLAGAFRYDEFKAQIVKTKKMYWENYDVKTDYDRTWKDADDAALRAYLDINYTIDNKSKIEDAFRNAANQEKFHPIRDYLKGLKWDGKERVATLFADFLGAEDNKLNKEITKLALKAAVGRVYKPGIKYDHVTTLFGGQGIGKSMLISKLARNREWFNDSLQVVGSKDAYELLQGSWIIELAEMAATRKADIETTKNFVTKTSDKYRPAYGRNTVDHPRQCVFFASTNEEEFLKDKTGNRRYLPITVGIYKDRVRPQELTPEYVDQLWAEAVQLFEQSSNLVLPAEVQSDLEEVIENHTDLGSSFGAVKEYLNQPITKNWNKLSLDERRQLLDDPTSLNNRPDVVERKFICVAQLLEEAIGHDNHKQVKPVQRNEAVGLMNNMKGWRKPNPSEPKDKRFGPYGVQKYYIKDETNN